MGIDPWGGQSEAIKQAAWSESVDGGGVFRSSSSPRLVLQGRRSQGTSEAHVTAQTRLRYPSPKDNSDYPHIQSPRWFAVQPLWNMAESARAIGLWDTMRDRAARVAVLTNTRQFSAQSAHHLSVCTFGREAGRGEPPICMVTQTPGLSTHGSRG